MDQDKAEALAEFLSVSVDEVEPMPYGDVFEAGGGEYEVLTDSEADEKARAYILDSLWAFNTDFIMDHLAKPVTGRAYDALEASIKHAQGAMCEDANELIATLIGDNINEFIDDAISADGRGHFLTTYDGEENEQGEYFIYRVN